MSAPLRKLVELFYELDVAVAVGRVTGERKFCFATACTDDEGSILLKGFSHPCVLGAVSNDLEVTKEKIYFS